MITYYIVVRYLGLFLVWYDQTDGIISCAVRIRTAVINKW